METAFKAATCIMFAAMAGVCLIGGVAVLIPKGLASCRNPKKKG